MTNVLQYFEQIRNDDHISQLNFSGTKIHDFNLDDIDIQDTLGATNRSVVVQALHKPSETTFAIKYITFGFNRFNHNEENTKKFRNLVREIQHFRELTHKNSINIVRFYGFSIVKHQILLCMELMDMSLLDLYKKVHSVNENFPEQILGCITVDVLKGLVACKEINLIHRDVKPDNLLLNRVGVVKVNDFGETRILHESLASSLSGTLAYWPPEHFIDAEKTDARADIWSLGIVLVELVLGRLPYEDTNGNFPKNIIVLQNLIKAFNAETIVSNIFKQRQNYTDEICEFVNLCLRKHETRPKYADLQTSNFYNIHSIEDDARHRIMAEFLNRII